MNRTQYSFTTTLLQIILDTINLFQKASYFYIGKVLTCLFKGLISNWSVDQSSLFKIQYHFLNSFNAMKILVIQFQMRNRKWFISNIVVYTKTRQNIKHIHALLNACFYLYIFFFSPSLFAQRKRSS